MKVFRNIIFKIKRRIASLLLSFVENDFKNYVVIVTNKNDKESKAILFGYNRYFFEKNFGSDDGIEIQTLSSYGELLCESQLKTQVKCLRVMNTKEPYDIFQWAPINYNYRKANGCSGTRPLLPSIYYNVNQIQENIVDIDEEFTIKGNTYLELTLKPKQEITLVFFNFKTKYINWKNE